MEAGLIFFTTEAVFLLALILIKGMKPMGCWKKARPAYIWIPVISNMMLDVERHINKDMVTSVFQSFRFTGLCSS